MANRPMNDDEVVNEMKKMVAFIKQEAMEKAREIKVKADEEFAIEKAKIVKQETSAIDAQFEKRRKASEVAQKTTQSTANNKARLKLLQAREQHLQELFDKAREQIIHLSGDQGRYEQFLQSVIVQCLLQMMEPAVVVQCRKKDKQVTERAGDKAAQQYFEISGRAVKIQVQADLSNDGAGGIKMSSADTRIKINNTLDERLKLLEDRMLPEIRHDLFGTNENRKYYT